MSVNSPEENAPGAESISDVATSLDAQTPASLAAPSPDHAALEDSSNTERTANPTDSVEAPTSAPIDASSVLQADARDTSAASSAASTTEPPAEAPGSPCPRCGAASLSSERFCESCGGPVNESNDANHATTGGQSTGITCSSCGKGTYADDGYCTDCGAPAPDPRAHIEFDYGNLVGVTDVGMRKRVNQDAMDGWCDGDRAVLVVCDGVSSAAASDVAAQRAAAAARARLVQAIAQGVERLGEGMIDAVRLAQEAVVSTPFQPSIHLDAPSCTIVAAVVIGRRAVIGWLGDSRAYWFTTQRGVQVSSDHSWATEMVNAGVMNTKQAEADNRAHMITRWLGKDAVDVTPQLVEIDLDPSGILLLCSDGLWNYRPTPIEISGVFSQPWPAREMLLPAAQQLCVRAKEAGGHDNIAIVAWGVGLPTAPSPSETAASVTTPTQDVMPTEDLSPTSQSPTSQPPTNLNPEERP